MNVTPRRRQDPGFEAGQELRAVMLGNHDPVGPKLLDFPTYAEMMALWGLRSGQVEERWESWPLVVFSEPDAD